MMRLLVTAGPTREYLDSVRFLSNASSGQMGYALAVEAASRGHEVVLVAGPVALPDPDGIEVVHVISAAEMFEAATTRFVRCDAAVMAAAVCDYRPATRMARKIRKCAEPRTLDLIPTADICAHLGACKGTRVVIGFAMEDHDPRAGAETKLEHKQCDAMVLNRIEAMGQKNSTIEILGPDGVWSGPFSGVKQALASHILDLVESLRKQA